MASLFISAEEQGIVVFRLWKSLTYHKRIGLSFILILSGFVMQYAMTSFFAGCVPILFGNLLLIVKGYDNRVNTGKFSPSAAWEKVDKSKFFEVERLHRDMKTWDRSVLDISNWRGFLSLAVISAIIGVVFFKGAMKFDDTLMIIAYDAALLLLPHWLTGIRSTLIKPNLVLKIKGFKRLLEESNRPWLAGHEVDYYMMLSGEEAKIPDDVKIRINVKNQHKDFLGLYGQIVTNQVSGTAYPYFYVVLVARKGFGLEDVYQTYTPPEKTTKEFKTEDDVEVLVIRQTTTKTSGYHTKNKKMISILRAGVTLADQVAVKM
ncbi:MAG: hypothetical protein HF978_20705 [Desulfobacteraceae bacterium]|nr:hypothetical protein [Desulfobacteraceae bacterium]MBC2757970.1 hypothetical protein [Desulfobacteraceae bacterium]